MDVREGAGIEARPTSRGRRVRARTAALCMTGLVVATASSAFAQSYCLPIPGRSGAEVLTCSSDDDVCMVWNEPGDACMGRSRSAACTVQRAMFCYAVVEPGAGAELDCFADLRTCRGERDHASRVERLETSRCLRASGDRLPYRLLNQTTPPAPRPHED